MRIAGGIPLLFSVHPRTRKNLEDNGTLGEMRRAKNLFLIEPLSYIPFMNLVFNCRFAITDSGGIQEETTYLGIPCLTMRPNTERPITISNGTNQLCYPENLESEVERILSGKPTQKQIPEYWDGHTAERVVNSIATFFG
jgi:UDP-N-acetylglucosamine 2-epimerase (non-hydrolysing)